MEVQKKNDLPQALEMGLDFWGKQEQKFQSLFGKDALKDKEFLKMKLRYYDNLWYKYKNAPLSIEGQLMRNMLKFQRKKLEKSLHHGLVRQIIRRINTAVKSGKALKAQRKAENKSRLAQYNQSSPRPEIPVSLKEPTVQQRAIKQDRKTSAIAKRRLDKTKQSKSYGYNHFHKPKRRTGKGLHH